MLTLQIPMLLALLGTALMAVVIFAPVPLPAKVTMSFAPPVPPPPLEQWHAARTDPFAAPPLEQTRLDEFWPSDRPLDHRAHPKPPHDDLSPIGVSPTDLAPTDVATADLRSANLSPADLARADFPAADGSAAAWPGLFDSRAAGCDAAARLALVDALAVVRAPWADAVLRRALDDEPDAGVRDAVVAALHHAGAR